jgi:hypothetical protein
MNKIKSTNLAAAMLVCALTLVSSQANAQTVIGPDTLANSSVVIPRLRVEALWSRTTALIVITGWHVGPPVEIQRMAIAESGKR